jgi:hypothetical protein
MEVRRSSSTPPAAAALAYMVGLGLVFLGERVLSATPGARWILTAPGIGLVIAYAGLRWMGGAAGASDRRSVDRLLAVLSTLTVVALGLELLSTEAGERLIGLAQIAANKRERIETIGIGVWVSLLVATMIPVLLSELALYPMRRAARIESRRVMAAASAGLAVGMAAAYATFFTYTAGELEIKADYSYFKTSEPSESTRNVVNNLGEPVKVVAFFPQLNDVGREVWGYLRDLARKAPRLTVEMHDRLLEPGLAKDDKVTQDGVLVVQKGTGQESLVIGADIDKARSKLKTLDADFQKVLLKVARPAKMAYLTVGHGELNEQAGEDGRSATGLKKLLEMQNYTVNDLGLQKGLGNEIPKDATVVMVLGPTRPFLPGEIATLKKYVQGGGHVLLALDPDGRTDLDPLAELVGIALQPGVLANDRAHLTRRHNDSDKAILVTNRFSSHASVSTLSRNSSAAAVIFLSASAIDKRPGADGALKMDFTVKSLPETYADTNGDFLYQSSEKKNVYNLAAAVSKPVSVDGKPGGKDAPEMRAFVLGDVDALSDAAFIDDANRVLFVDAFRWLGGEESFTGAIATTEDPKIQHTKQQDLVWFYGTILGMPSLVLGLGLLYASKKRAGRKPTAPTESTGMRKAA